MLRRFPALFAPASLKPLLRSVTDEFREQFSGAFCAGLIEAGRGLGRGARQGDRFPALFAPASLKRGHLRLHALRRQQFSGAFCAGLIEAKRSGERLSEAFGVFRRFLRRPH